MTEQREMVRVNTRISAEVNDWLDERSKTTGVPKSSIIHMALETYIQQLRSISAMEVSGAVLQELYQKVDLIEKKLTSGNAME
jgi:predicted DNA-binding protein